MTDFNAEHIRKMQEQLAEVLLDKFAQAHPAPKAEIPAPLKWAGAIIAALFTAGTAALAFWLVSTVNGMQVTLAEVNERLRGNTTSQDGRFSELDRRVSALEARDQARRPQQ